MGVGEAWPGCHGHGTTQQQLVPLKVLITVVWRAATVCCNNSCHMERVGTEEWNGWFWEWKSQKTRPLFLTWVEMSHKSLSVEISLSILSVRATGSARLELYNTRQLQAAQMQTFTFTDAIQHRFTYGLGAMELKINTWEQKRPPVPTRMIYSGHDLIFCSVGVYYQIYDKSLSNSLEGCLDCVKVTNVISSTLCLCFPSQHPYFSTDLSPLWLLSMFFVFCVGSVRVICGWELREAVNKCLRPCRVNSVLNFHF